MQLEEFVFQGPFGCRTPVRIRATNAVEDVVLPPGMTDENFHDLLTAVLYPTHTTASLRMELAQNAEAKLAATFTTQSRRYRVVRRGDIESIKLQAEADPNQFKSVASGRKEVESFLQTNLELPEFDQFWTLNFWRFDNSPSGVSGLDADLLDKRVRDVVMKYRLALKAESIEDRVKSLESQISDRQKQLGKGMELESKLRKAQDKLTEIEVAEIREDDLELLKNRDEVLARLEDQVLRLESEEDATRQQVDNTLPQNPLRNPLFWAGVVVGVGVILAGFINPSIRIVALADIAGFGLAAYVVIQYFSGMERASVHLVRLDSIKRRLGQVREEETSVTERLNHLLIHAGVRDAKELGDRVGMTDRLRDMISQLKSEVDALRSDPDYVRATSSLKELEQELIEAQKIRDDLPDEVMSSYQLETDLQSMGIDPLAVIEESEAEVSEAANDAETSPLERILIAAHQTSQYDEIELSSKTKKMWAKICSHVLGERFSNVDIKNGALTVGALGRDQMDMWIRTRPSEHQVVLGALALSVQVNSIGRSTRGSFGSIFIPDLTKSLTGSQPKKLRDVFSSAGKRTNVFILKTGV